MSDHYVVMWRRNDGDGWMLDECDSLQEAKNSVATHLRAGYKVRALRELVVDMDVYVWDEKPGQETL